MENQPCVSNVYVYMCVKIKQKISYELWVRENLRIIKPLREYTKSLYIKALVGFGFTG